MKLSELDPSFLISVDERTHRRTNLITEADGVIFLCPKCYQENINSDRGIHSIICWQPHIPLDGIKSGPGRWNFEGTGYDDLSLVNGSSSVALNGGCNAHFWIKNGEIINC